RVLVKLCERSSQPLLHLRGKRLLALAPVERYELGELVGTLDYTQQRLSHKLAVRCQTSHLTHQQQRSVTQLHVFAGLDRQRGNLLSRNLWHQFADASGDSYSIFVELVFPQHASQNGTAQFMLRGNMLCRRTFMGTPGIHPRKQICPGHDLIPFETSCRERPLTATRSRGYWIVASAALT